MYMYVNNHNVHFLKTDEYTCTMYFMNIHILYSLDQMPLSISRRSRIEAAPPDTLKEIVAALK